MNREIWRYIIAAILTVFAVLYVCLAEAGSETEKPKTTGVEQFQEIKETVEDRLSQEEEEAIRMEADRIEAALIEQGYYREDIPLTFQEQDYLHTAAEEFGVDYYVMVGLIEVETNFRNIQGDGGNAYGYCQIWPKWWGDLMVEIGAEDLNDPYDNFRTAAAILAQHMERYGSVEDALTCYNTGKPGNSTYSRDVLANAEKWRKP